MTRHTKIGKYPFTDSEVAELRQYFGEQIAKEIEVALPDDPTAWGCIQTLRTITAAITRGKND